MSCDIKRSWNVGRENHKWAGGMTLLNKRKYVGIWVGEYHPKKEAGNYVREHVLVAEKALGKFLPYGAVVHHVDNNGLKNTGNNLVICQDDLYHRLLHKRKRAYESCGHADWLKCKFCKKYDDPKNLKLVQDPNRTAGYHEQCQHDYDKKRRSKK